MRCTLAMVLTIINYVIVVFLGIVMCAPPINKDGKVYCKEISNEVLEEILGPAYNARYMSINEPVLRSGAKNLKRTTAEESLDLNVDPEFSETIEEQPAWAIKSHVGLAMENVNQKRFRRDTKNKQEWQCETTVKWTDLGQDYFPRYIKSIECLQKNCWFNMYKCKPRSFTVKILKRRRNRCVTAAPGTKVGVDGLPYSLKELWVWEERALTFCCDCSL